MTQDEIQAVARAVHGELSHIDVMKYLDMPDDTADRVAQAAIAALDAARGKAEPVAWMYIRKPEEWPPANPVVGLNKWKYDDPARPYWIETPLYFHPPADRVAQVVEWLRNGGGTDISQLSGSTQMLFLKGMNRYADAIERGEPFNG